MAQVSLRGLRKVYDKTVVLDDFNLDIAEGELVVLLGPSGCGKTTTLRTIAGFVEPTKGQVFVGGRDLTRAPSHDRNIGVVFQNYALFPHMTVFENVAFGLRRRRARNGDIQTRVQAALRMVEMDRLALRRPAELSGGQQQRVAIARATVISPDVLLLDEPLSNLDAKLRVNIRREIRQMQRVLGITTILVTHDQEEAMSVADRIVVMNGGRVQQVGRPGEVYARPANRFVVDFIGGANFIHGGVDAQGRFVTTTGLSLVAKGLDPGCHCVAIRPEAASIAQGAAPAGENVFPFRITSVTYLGPAALVDGVLASGEALSVHVAASGPPGALEAFHASQDAFVHIPPYAVLGIRDEPPTPA